MIIAEESAINATRILAFALATLWFDDNKGHAFQASSPKLFKGRRKLALFLFQPTYV